MTLQFHGGLRPITTLPMRVIMAYFLVWRLLGTVEWTGPLKVDRKVFWFGVLWYVFHGLLAGMAVHVGLLWLIEHVGRPLTRGMGR